MQKKSDIKMFLSWILWLMAPSVYLLFRMNIVTVNNVDINILGQMEWFDLIDEVITTAFVTPLYFLLKGRNSKNNGFSFALSFGVYFLFTVIISLYIGNISEFMNVRYAKEYLLIQSVSMLISFIVTFVMLLFMIYENYKCIVIFTGIKLVSLTMFDFLLIPVYKDLGAAYSEIIVNTIIAAALMVIVISKKYISFAFCESGFLRSWAKKGSFSALQIFLDNFIYAMIVCRMVNAVLESGNYWVANNFIWGWLLVPVMALVQVIQKNALEKITFSNVWKYAVGIVLFWIITVPFWRFFIHNAMGIDNYGDILNILYILVPYYLCYIASAVPDAWFISKGKTLYLFINSFIVNIGYYGIMYILFRRGVFALNIEFIIHLFGLGMAVHMVVSGVLYFYEKSKKIQKKNI